MSKYLLVQEREQAFQDLIKFFKSGEFNPEKKKILTTKICSLDLKIESES